MLSGAFVRNVIDIDPICKNKDTLAYVVNYGTGWGNNVDNSLYSLTDYNGWYVQGYIFKNDKNIIQLYE